MHSTMFLSALAAVPLAVSAEQVIGVYMFHRHGDRTAKAWPPVNLTALGADEAHSSGEFYRRRYVESSADLRIKGISSDTAVLSQLAVTSAVDAVLHNSAVTFLQGLYPPIGTASETLANGTKVEGPLNGYQFVPVNAINAAATSNEAESSEWLQGNSGCSKAEVSSNNYFQTPEYRQTYEDAKSFYQSLLPVVNTTFNSTTATFKNAYTIFDYINVASIHNQSIPSKSLLTRSTKDRLFDLASTHEWNLAYNGSDPVRAVAGSVLAGQIVTALQSIVDGKKGATKFNAQFGAYGTFMSFFGLAQLPKASNDFYGICDYASSMTFELVTNATATPTAEDISVRFYFSNGTAAASDNSLKQYPLFGQDKTTLPWTDFKTAMLKFAVSDTQHWCTLCGNTDGQCASNSTTSGDDSASSSSSGESGGSGVSKPVAGVIGALVTLVVILAVQAAVMLIGGLRLVKKSTLAQAGHAVAEGTKA